MEQIVSAINGEKNYFVNIQKNNSTFSESQKRIAHIKH